MSWMKNLISYSDTGNPGECPKCGSKKITVTEHKNTRKKSLTFLCNECGSSDHFDGVTETQKRFRTAWQKDTPDSKPRIITAFREDD